LNKNTGKNTTQESKSTLEVCITYHSKSVSPDSAGTENYKAGDLKKRRSKGTIGWA
jgi:hypothetical protein